MSRIRPNFYFVTLREEHISVSSASCAFEPEQVARMPVDVPGLLYSTYWMPKSPGAPTISLPPSTSFSRAGTPASDGEAKNSDDQSWAAPDRDHKVQSEPRYTQSVGTRQEEAP